MGGRSTGLVPAALLLASLTGILAFSKNFVNSSLPDSKFTFVVNFDFSQVICQHSENKSDLHVHEMSILCDGKQDCFSNPAMHDESFPYCEKKCTSTCNNRGACLYDGHQPQCYCNSGFSGPSCEFIDKNECLDRPCHLMADCLNTPIGFSCVCRPGFHGDGYQCADIDECSTPNLCPDHSNCVNLPGTHYCNCTEGFTQKGDTLVTKCLDINECELGNHNCGKNQLCENTIGGFTCVSGCTEGYELINGECFDIDECKNKGVCDTRAECFNSPGSYSCVCEDGMTGDGKHCEPVADCTQREDICDRHAQCIYPFKMCQCVAGFVGDGITCHDIDECEASEEPCKNQKGKRCVNIVGGHICCEKGSDDARCIEEQGVFCAGGCGLNAFCGNKTCECLPGYSGDPQKKCLDVNECDADNLCPGVGQWCVNVFGSYLCCGPHSTEPECQGVHIFRNSDGTTSVLHSNHSKEVVVSAEQGEHSVTQQGGFIAVGLGVIRANGTLPSISVLSRRACTSYCPINSECVAGYCECSKGFGGNPHLGCEDINECELNTPCGEQTDDNWCVNTEGSFTCCTRDSSQDECIGLEIISGPGGGLRLVGGQKDDKIYHASVNETLKLEEFSAKVHQYQNTSEGGAILIVKQTVPTDVTILKPEEGEMGLEITGDGIKKERTQTPRATVTLPGIISTIGGFSSTTTAIPVTEIPIHVPGVSQKSPEDKKNETSGTTVLILPSSLAPKPDVEGSGLESTEDGDMLQSEKSTTQTSSTLRGNINVRFTTLDELRGNVNGTRTTVKEDKEVTKGPKTVIDGDGHEQEATIDGKADKRSKTTIDRDESGDVSVIDRIVGTTANPTEEEPDPDKEGLEIVHKQTKPVTDVSTVKPSQSSTTEILSTTAKSTTDSVTGSVSSDKPDLVEDKGEKSGQEHDDKKPSGVKSAAIDQKESGSSGSSSSSSSGTVIITQGNGGEKEAASPNNKPKTPEPEDHQGQNTFEEEKTTTEPTTGETGLEIKWEGAAGRPTSEVASTEGISSEVTSATLLSSTVDDTKSGTDKVSTTASSISATPETTGESALKTTTDGMPDTDIHDGENPESTQGEDGNTGRKFTKSPETDEEKNTSEPTTVETGLEIVFKGTTTPLIPPGSTVGVSSTPIQSITETISFLSTSTPAANVSSESPDTVGTTREGHVNVSIGPSPTSTEETTPEAGLEIIHVSTTTAQSTTVEEEKITAVDNGETATTAETTAETSGKTSQGSSEGTTNSTPLSVSIPATPEEGLEIFGKPLHSTEKPAETTATLEKEENKASTIGTTVEKIETTTAPTDALSTEQPDLVLTVNTTGAPASTETTTHSSTAEASAATTTAETADITTDGAGQSSTIGDSKMSTETSSSATTTTLVTMKKAESETTTASTPAEAITTTEILEAAKKMTSSTSDGSITAEELTTTESVTATAESASSEKISPEIVPLVITPSLESTTTEQPDLVLLTASSKGTLKPSDSSTSAARKTTAESTTVSVTITEKATSPSSIDSTGTPSVIVVASTSETTIPPPLSSSTLVSSIATSSLSPPTKATSESMTSGSPSFESTASPIEVSTTQLTTVQKTSISTKISQATQIPTTIRLPSTSLSTPSLTSTSHPSSTLGTSASTAASTSSPTSSIEPTAPSTTVAGLSTVESARNPNEAIAITNIAQEEKTSTAAISNGPTGETTQITLETAPGEIATKAPGTDIETATSNPDDDLTAAPTKQQRLPPTDVPAESESSTSSSRPSEKGTTKDIYSLPEKPTPSPVTLGPNNATKCVSSDECGDDALCERRTGVCRCQPGFQGAPPSTPCSDVDECAEGLHKCHDSARCHNIVGTYACFCPMGYRKNESGACIDIDECAESRGNCCSVNGTCVNKEGSYGCECKPGFFGDGYKCMPMEKRICTEAELIKAGCGQHHVCMVDGLGVTDCNTCKMGFKMVNGNCTDVNECAEPELNMCSRSADCNNLLGTYACSCKQGFKGDGYMCEDIDECSGNPCHPQAECENLLGSFKCTCPAGFTGDGIKECQNPLEKSCENVKEFCGRIDHVACLSVRIFNGSLSSVCECEPGFRFNKQKNTCEDINECDENRHNCDPASSTCANEEGSFHCDCAEGYEGIGGVCVDVNECERGTAGCHSMAMCLNQPGSCGCKCMHGFTGDGIQCNPLQKREEDNACTAEWDRLCLLENKTCHVDEEDVPQCGSCIEGHHPINGSCQPVHGAGTCADPKKNTCDKNAECIDIPGTPGKHFCTCKKGFIGDGLRCDDIDECSLTGICHLHATCQNVPGSFNCICNTGYTGNGFTCTKEAGPNCHLNGELCHKDAECTMDGQCKCKDGFEGDGFKTCTEIGSTPTTTPAAIDSTTTGKQATFTQKTESTVKETTTTEPPILTEDTRSSTSTSTGPMVKGSITEIEGPESVEMIPGAARVNLTGVTTVAPTMTTPATAATKLSVGPEPPSTIPASLAKTTHQSAAPPSMTPPNFETTELAPTTEAEIYGSTTPEDNVASTSTDSTWTEATTDDGIEVRTELVGHSSEVPQREGQRGLCTAEDRSRCHEFAICDLSTNSCRCKDGFKGDGYTNCQYKITSNCITNTSLCHPDAFCDRHVQKCACNAGYIGDGILCSPDPQDCVLRKELCSTDATCSGRRCHCVEGFTGDGIKCVSLHQRSANCSECDVNAHCDQGVCTCNIGYFGNGLCCVPDPRDCVHFPGICHPEAACDSQNRQCACRKGYLGDGISCFPAVSCVTDSSVCHKNAICLPSGHCMCRNGFEGNGHSCQQITALGLRSEGHDVPSLCGNKCNRESELCIDNECICKHGFKKTNGVCEDVDECLKSPCHPLASCQNTRGSYSCACPEGYVGDGKACVQHLKIGDLGVFCENDGMTLVLSNETQMFEGKMYVRGQAENPHCIKTFSPLQQHSRPYTFKVFFEHCNVQLLENNTFAATVIVQKHPHFITTSADSYELKCAYSPDVTKVQSHVNVSELAPTSTLSNQFDGPTCSLKITDDQNDFVESAKVGQSMVLRLEVSPNGTYGILPRDCVAVNIETGERYHLTDRHGCAVDDQLFPEFAQLHPSATEAVFRTFKWPDSSMIRFQCDCMACVGPCPMPDCNRLQKKLLPRFRRAHQGENDEIELDNQLESENVVDTKRKAFSRLLAVHEDVEEQISQEDVQQWSRSALSESLPSEGVCVKAAVLVGSSLLLILSFGFLTSVVLHRRRSNPSKSPDSPISVISF